MGLRQLSSLLSLGQVRLEKGAIPRVNLWAAPEPHLQAFSGRSLSLLLLLPVLLHAPICQF